MDKERELEILELLENTLSCSHRNILYYKRIKNLPVYKIFIITSEGRKLNIAGLLAELKNKPYNHINGTISYQPTELDNLLNEVIELSDNEKFSTFEDSEGIFS